MTAHPLGGHIEAMSLSSGRAVGRCGDLPARVARAVRHTERENADGGERFDGVSGAIWEAGGR